MTILSRQGVQYQENHKNEDKGSGIIISLAIMLTMAYIAVGLRFTSRRMIQAKLSYDDWVIVIGLVCNARSRAISLHFDLDLSLMSRSS